MGKYQRLFVFEGHVHIYESYHIFLGKRILKMFPIWREMNRKLVYYSVYHAFQSFLFVCLFFPLSPIHHLTSLFGLYTFLATKFWSGNGQFICFSGRLAPVGKQKQDNIRNRLSCHHFWVPNNLVVAMADTERERERETESHFLKQICMGTSRRVFPQQKIVEEKT